MSASARASAKQAAFKQELAEFNDDVNAEPEPEPEPEPGPEPEPEVPRRRRRGSR